MGSSKGFVLSDGGFLMTLSYLPKTVVTALSVLFLLHFSAITASGQSNKQEWISFKKHVLTGDFISEGVTVADVNNDGLKDILAGAFYFLAPDWTKHALDQPQAFKVNGGYSNSFLNFSQDIDQDGWIDLIRIDEPGKAVYWYKNPGKKSGRWTMQVIYEQAGNETPILADVDEDGKNDLIFNDPAKKEMIWLSPPASNGSGEWKKHIISADSTYGTHKYTHGVGFGDVNGDGYNDIIIKDGWWQGSSDPTQDNWKFNKANLGQECSNMLVYDVNQDGLNDIISSSAHKYGIWWHEQVKDAGGKTTWKEHEIYTRFSQTHSLIMQDINGDGYPDLITGKRYFAHNGNDPGAMEPAVLYWFEFKPGKMPKWIPHEIDNNSGVGLNFVVEDVNNDGSPDIVVANKKGVHYFEQVK